MLARKILLNTILSNLVAVAGLGLALLFTSQPPMGSPLLLILVVMNSIVPTLLAVLLYYFLIKRIKTHNSGMTFALRVTVSIAVFSLSLIIWAIADVLFTGSGSSIDAVKEDYRSEFSGFSVIAVMLGILIPAFDILLDRK